MVLITMQHTVKDYDKWRPFFDEHEKMRKEHGMKSSKVFYLPENKNEITIVFDWESKYKALKFLNESNVKDVMKDAGVVSMPNSYFLESV